MTPFPSWPGLWRYGLPAVLRLHIAQENKSYFSLGECTALTSTTPVPA
jgi:hypothetical protein